MVNVVCLKYGNKYSSQYVNVLRAMVARNLSIPHRFACVTEDTAGLNSDVETIPLAQELNDKAARFHGWWYKPSMFKKILGDLTGRTMFLDLDVVIVDSIDEMFTVDPGFWIIRDWNSRPPHLINNSSVMLYDIGQHTQVWDDFIKNPEPIMKRLAGDQNWITEKVKDANIWPEQWVKSYKYHCVDRYKNRYTPPYGTEHNPPEDCKIVVFHGKPDPHEAANSQNAMYKNSWVREHWKE